MLKHLNVDEMVGLIAPWVTDPKRKALFLSIPEIASLHPKLAPLHTDLLAIRPTASGMSPGLRKIVDDALQLDDRHDHLARAAAAGLEADRHHSLAADPPDPERARKGYEVSKKLFPGGLNVVNASYVAESGNTARVAKLLHDEPDVGAFLKSIPVHGKATLLDTVQRWIAAGAELGKLERKREELEARETAKPASKATVTALRSRWIRLVTLILSSLEVSDATAEAIETIRGPVLKASDRAAKRYAAGGSDEGSTTQDEAATDGEAVEPAEIGGNG